MNHDRIAGMLKQVGGNLKVRWGRFTADPLLECNGTRDIRAGQFQERYGLSKEHSEHQLQEFRNRNREWDPSNQ